MKTNALLAIASALSVFVTTQITPPAPPAVGPDPKPKAEDKPEAPKVDPAEPSPVITAEQEAGINAAFDLWNAQVAEGEYQIYLNPSVLGMDPDKSVGTPLYVIRSKPKDGVSTIVQITVYDGMPPKVPLKLERPELDPSKVVPPLTMKWGRPITVFQRR